MKYDLASMARRQRNIRRSSITIRDIVPPAVLATDFYQAAYLPVVDLWSRYGERVIAEYERTISALTIDAPADINATLNQGDSEFQRLILLLTPALRSWLVRVETWYRGKWRGAVLAATSVDLQTLIGADDVRATLDEYLNWNAALVRDVSEQARQRIAAATFSGLAQRKPAREVAREIREAVGMARDRSIRIASDQLAKATSALADERQREAGITTVEWKSSHKLHFRPHHAARDGKLFDLDTHAAIDGGAVVPAGDWVGQPPFCGCRTLARISFE